MADEPGGALGRAKKGQAKLTLRPKSKGVAGTQRKPRKKK